MRDGETTSCFIHGDLSSFGRRNFQFAESSRDDLDGPAPQAHNSTIAKGQTFRLPKALVGVLKVNGWVSPLSLPS